MMNITILQKNISNEFIGKAQLLKVPAVDFGSHSLLTPPPPASPSLAKRGLGGVMITERGQGEACSLTNARLRILKRVAFGCLLFVCLFLLLGWLFVPVCGAEVLRDWVVAFVDDEAITNSELQKQFGATLKVTPDISREEVLNTMINRMLILREAKKYRIEGPSQEAVIKEYIDLKERAFIRVPETEIEKYYRENSGMFSGKGYEDVRDDMEQYLIEKELNVRLKKTLDELRKTAYIKILPKGGGEGMPQRR